MNSRLFQAAAFVLSAFAFTTPINAAGPASQLPSKSIDPSKFSPDRWRGSIWIKLSEGPAMTSYYTYRSVNYVTEYSIKTVATIDQDPDAKIVFMDGRVVCDSRPVDPTENLVGSGDVYSAASGLPLGPVFDPSKVSYVKRHIVPRSYAAVVTKPICEAVRASKGNGRAN